MEHIHHIRYEFNEKGKSLRQISRETGHDRQTVKKIVEQEDFSKPDPIKRPRSSKTDHHRVTTAAAPRWGGPGGLW